MVEKSRGSSKGPSKELKELMNRRREEHEQQVQQQERRLVHGRWVTDKGALRNRDTRRSELLSRKAPKRLAHMSLYNQLEDTDTGIEVEDHEVVDRVTQDDIVTGVDIQTQSKKFSLTLDKLGPYKIDFTTNGTHLLLAGLRGHMANIRWKDFDLLGEVQLKDRLSDATFLVDHTMTAAAQKKYVYMYTKEGAEMHILSKFANMDRLAYLRKHMLLAATSSTYSVMQYLDISTGQELGTKVPAVMKNPSSCLAVNPINDVVATADLRGVVKFWSPTVVDPLVQLKGHAGVVDAVCFHPNGRFFLTLGGDHKMKVWDTRTLRPLEEYATSYCFNTLDISSTGLVAMGGGTNVQIWKGLFGAQKPSAPFMKFGLGYGNIASQVRFCPFEDVLGIGHSRGFTSFLVPGSGEANPDFFYANPHETERHRQERVVSSLLDKLPPDTISMDVQVAGVNEARLAEYNENLRLNRKAKAIREKKQRRAERALGPRAPTGLHVGDDAEVDEDIGFKEKPVTRDLRTKQDKARERKMSKWDKKDSSDKVRSKQTMRQSRIAQQRRSKNVKEARDGVYPQDDLNAEEEAALQEAGEKAKLVAKRRRTEAEIAAKDLRGSRSASRLGQNDAAASSAQANAEANAAFKRFL